MSTAVHTKVAYCQILHKHSAKTPRRLFTRVTNHIPEGDTLMIKSSCKSITEWVETSSSDLREREQKSKLQSEWGSVSSYGCFVLDFWRTGCAAFPGFLGTLCLFIKRWLFSSSRSSDICILSYCKTLNPKVT